MEKRYLVIDELNRHYLNCDVSVDVCRTAEEANERAEYLWWHLTPSEKKKRHIYVGVLTEDDLDQNEVEEYGLDDDEAWLLYDGLDDFPGAFDSDKEVSSDD